MKRLDRVSLKFVAAIYVWIGVFALVQAAAPKAWFDRVDVKFGLGVAAVLVGLIHWSEAR